MNYRFILLPTRYSNALSRFSDLQRVNQNGMNMIGAKVYEHVNGGVKVFHPDGVVIFYNNAWEFDSTSPENIFQYEQIGLA